MRKVLHSPVEITDGIQSIVTAENIGIGSEDGILSFTSSLDTVNHVLKPNEQSPAGVAVRVKTLDGAIRKCSANYHKDRFENGFYLSLDARAHHELHEARVFNTLSVACAKICDFVATEQHFARI